MVYVRLWFVYVYDAIVIRGDHVWRRACGAWRIPRPTAAHSLTHSHARSAPPSPPLSYARTHTHTHARTHKHIRNHSHTLSLRAWRTPRPTAVPTSRRRRCGPSGTRRRCQWRRRRGAGRRCARRAGRPRRGTTARRAPAPHRQRRRPAGG
jgi:hypothetical protein